MLCFLLGALFPFLRLAHARQLIPPIFQQDICTLEGHSLFAESLLTTSKFNSSNTPKSHTHIPKYKPSAPWTRKSECSIDDITRRKYCVYTDENFADGRGITLFTSPSIARRIQALPAFMDPIVYENDGDPPWEVKSVPGRGNGLFATRTIRRGDKPIFNRPPIAIYQSDALIADFKVGYKMLHKTFENLPELNRRLFLRMAPHSEGNFVMEKINTNAFAGEIEGQPHFFLYPEAAFMNHDCRPNAMYYQSSKTLTHSTYASRTIHPGEEITAAYINILQSRAERQALLQQVWNFSCTCSVCSDPHFHKSDSRLEQIATLQTQLTDWSGGSRASPAMAQELLDLYRIERVHSAEGPGHMFAAFAYNAIGDVSMAKKHAKLALDAGLVTAGLAETDEDEMRELKSDPREHWTYLARAGKQNSNALPRK